MRKIGSRIMESRKLKALKAIGSQLPTTNSQIAARTGYNTQAQIGQAIQQNIPTNQAASLVAAQSTAAQGQQQVQQTQQQTQQNQQIGQIAMQDQQMTAQNQQFQRNMRTDKDRLQSESRLAQLNQTLKGELIDEQLQFQRDEAGRVFLNERQLMDFAVLQAEDKEQLMDYEQTARQASDRTLQLMEIMHKRLTQELQLDFEQREQRLSLESRRSIIEKQHELEKQYLKKKAKAANITGVLVATGTIVGAVYGGPVGAAAGGAAGGALGGTLS
jgi:hypothetical protein